jgi:hypothetical protein
MAHSAIFRKGTPHQCTVKVVREGGRNSRVIFPDGHDEKIENGLLSDHSTTVATPPAPSQQRVVPITPLRRLYRKLRAAKGDPNTRFLAIQNLLVGRRGSAGANFLQELFLRSKQHMAHYNNEDEAFYEPGKRPQRTASHFANKLVNHLTLKGSEGLELDDIAAFDCVDYEINPLRTTGSCWESGKAATNSGAGGMDLLLVTKSVPPHPVIAEIKASTESVGATFALIQTLTYAVELVTESQWRRLRKHFSPFHNCSETAPCVRLMVILQSPVANTDDLNYAISLAQELLVDNEISASIARIDFVECQIDEGDGKVVMGRLSGNSP